MIFHKLGVKGTDMFKVMIKCSSKTYESRGSSLKQWLIVWSCWVQLVSCSVMSGHNKGHNPVDFTLNDVQACCAGGCSMKYLNRPSNIEDDNMPSCC